MAINEEELKIALKEGFDSIKASDSLRHKTLERCAEELEKQSKKVRIFGTPRGRFVFGGLASMAACALILGLFYVNFPLRDMSSKSSAPEGALAMSARSGSAGKNGNDKVVAFEDASDGYAGEGSVADSEGDVSSTPAPQLSFGAPITPSSAPSKEAAGGFKSDSGSGLTEGDGRSSEVLISGFTLTQQALLGSSILSASDFNGANADDASEAAQNIVLLYNKQLDPPAVLKEDEVFAVYGAASEKLTAEGLASVNSYKELISGKGYYAAPLYGENEELIALLSFSMSPELDGKNQNLSISGNLAYDSKGRSWVYMDNTLVAENTFDAGLLYDEAAVESLMKQKTGHAPLTSPIVVDIRYGMDYILFTTAGGKEYGIPFVTDEERYDLKNNEVYDFKNLVEHLLKGLKGQ